MADPPVINGAIDNDILCYISSSRHTLDKERIMKLVFGFYDGKNILEAKDLLFKVCKMKATKRNKCTSHPEPLIADIDDIYELFQKMDNSSNVNLPTFVTTKFNAFPPDNFESIADVLCTMRDETNALRFEITQLRELSAKDMQAMEDICSVKQDIADIKAKVYSRPIGHESSGNVNTTSIPIQSSNNNAESETVVPTQENNSVSENTEDNSVPTNQDNQNPWVNVVRRGNGRRGGQNGNGSRGAQTGRGNRGSGSGRGRQNGNLAPNQQRVSRSASRSAGNSHRPRRINQNIIGTRSTATGISLAGVEKVVDLFLGGCPKNTSIECVSNYCRDSGVTPKKVELLETKSEWHSPFKISLSITDREKLLDASFWPENCFVRKFFRPRVGVVNS